MILSIISIMCGTVIVDLLFTKKFNMQIAATTISAFATLLSSILIIPIKITEFVFNKEEQKNISEIIKNIQDFDMGVRNGIKEYKEKSD